MDTNNKPATSPTVPRPLTGDALPPGRTSPRLPAHSHESPLMVLLLAVLVIVVAGLLLFLLLLRLDWTGAQGILPVLAGGFALA